MAGRIRTIKPELLEDAVTAALGDMASRLFIAMILLADDYGRLRAEPGWLMGQVYWARTTTLSVEDFLAAMRELVPLVLFYTVSGQRYAQIKNWGKHQRVDKPGKPRVPPPSEDVGQIRESFATVSRDPRESLATDLRPPTMDHDPEGEEDHARGAPPPELGEAKDRYREAYCRGIAKAKGAPYAWPGTKYAEWDLNKAIATFALSSKDGKPLRGASLLGWIEDAAQDFVDHVIKSGDDPKFWSQFAPKGLLRFLNQETRAAEARHVG